MKKRILLAAAISVVVPLFMVFAFFQINSEFSIETTMNAVGLSSDSIANVQLSIIPKNENALCIYNINSNISRQICEYYLLKRPGAHSLGLNIPDEIFWDSKKEDMSASNFDNYVKFPVYSWLDENPKYNITHVAIAKDIPIRADYNSASHRLAVNLTYYAPDKLNDLFGKTEHFNPQKYKGKIRFVASYLNGYNLRDIKMMIDKAVSGINNYSGLKWLVDADLDGIQTMVSDSGYVVCGSHYKLNETSREIIAWEPMLRRQDCNFQKFSSYKISSASPYTGVYFAPSDYLNLAGSWELVEKGEYYIFNVSMPAASNISAGSVYGNNGQNFSAETRVLNWNSAAKFNPDNRILLRNAKKLPPQTSGVLRKISGDGPDEILFFSFAEPLERINATGSNLMRFSVNDELLNAAYSNLAESGIKEENIIIDRVNEPISFDGEIAAYGGPGIYHNNYNGGFWAVTKGNFNFDVSNRSIITSFESFNAATFAGNTSHYPSVPGMGSMAYQGLLADFISDTAFGGDNYSRSFSGAAGTVQEPTGSGVSRIPVLMFGYANGLTLAEAAAGSWYSFTSNGGGSKGIAIGDPLMRITDENKSGVGAECGSYEDCISGFCDLDKSGVKRCRGNPQNCINGEPAARGDFIAFETKNSSGYCFNSTHLRNCSDGIWQASVYCGEGMSCSNGACRLADGELCDYSEECAGNYCSNDIFGVKRCHRTEWACILDESGKEISHYQTSCIDSSNAKRCLENSSWSADIVYCAHGCVNNSCYYPEEYHIELVAGKFYHLTMPFLQNSYMIENIFNLLPESSFFTWENKTWQDSTCYLENGLVFCEPAGKLLPPGKGFLVQSYQNATLTFKGDKSKAPAKLFFNGGWNLIGMPFCYEYYNASKLLREINDIDKSCTSVLKYSLENSNYDWFSLNQSYSPVPPGLNQDFNITNHESYFILCNDSADFTFTPECPYCGDSACNNSETCSSCPQDCGVCASAAGEGAGGGGGRSGSRDAAAALLQTAAPATTSQANISPEKKEDINLAAEKPGIFKRIFIRLVCWISNLFKDAEEYKLCIARYSA